MHTGDRARDYGYNDVFMSIISVFVFLLFIHTIMKRT